MLQHYNNVVTLLFIITLDIITVYCLDIRTLLLFNYSNNFKTHSMQHCRLDSSRHLYL